MNGAPAIADVHKDILQLADIFCVNESEAEVFISNTIKINNIESAYGVLSLLLNQGCKIVIITLGPLGAVFASKDEPKPQWVQVPKIENPLDTSVSNIYKILYLSLCCMFTFEFWRIYIYYFRELEMPF